VLVVWAARHDMGVRRMEETKRFICYCLDAAIAAADAGRNPGAQIKCLFDLSGVRLPSAGPFVLSSLAIATTSSVPDHALAAHCMGHMRRT
jgi:hypothetical protein